MHQHAGNNDSVPVPPACADSYSQQIDQNSTDLTLSVMSLRHESTSSLAMLWAHGLWHAGTGWKGCFMRNLNSIIIMIHMTSTLVVISTERVKSLSYSEWTILAKLTRITLRFFRETALFLGVCKYV